MKAIVYKKYGAPSVLQVQQVEKPMPADNEVLIKIGAAEVTKTDCEMRGFKFSVMWFWLPLRIALGIMKPKKQILGGYFAGEIAALGKDVVTFEVGDRVFGSAQFRLSAYAEYLCLPASYTIVPMPDNLSFAQAAAVPLGGLNALHFLRKANIKRGEKVLINGAGGSIGSFAVQIAKTMKAEVTAVDCELKAHMIRAIGADHFVDYTVENAFSKGKCYDVIFDMVTRSSYSACIKSLNPNGRYLIGNPRLTDMLRSIVTTRFTDKTAIFAFAGEKKEELLALKDMIEKGLIQVIVDKAYPFEQASEAHSRVETEQRLGAIVVCPEI